MKKVVTICAVAAMLSFVGATDTAKADHCSSRSGFSFGFVSPGYARPVYYSNYSYPTYYRTPSYGYGYNGYSNYSRPVYSRSGFSISIGSGYRSSYGHSHNRYRSFNRSPFYRR